IVLHLALAPVLRRYVRYPYAALVQLVQYAQPYTRNDMSARPVVVIANGSAITSIITDGYERNRYKSQCPVPGKQTAWKNLLDSGPLYYHDNTTILAQ
ncbi:MAG: hypothetical protein ACREBW_08955, partial [Candidatus Micrarchaeaceae archaeon]